MSLYVNIKKKLGDTLLAIEFETGEEPLGILGASGSGKSMTLKCIAGIECPDVGQIIYNNRVLFDSDKGINIPIRERNIGYLFQNYALFPHMTVEENIKCGLSQVQYEEGRLSILLEVFQIADIKKIYPKQLSGGQKQRVALARMMSVNPEVILLDEPFSALDHQLKVILQDEFEKLLVPFNKTMILVSHDLGEIERMCTWTMLINEGRNTLPRVTEDVINCPTTLHEAQLVSTRNISRVEIQSTSLLYIPEWGYTVKVETGNKVHEYIAVDSQHMHLVECTQANSFKASGIKVKEKAFSYEIRTAEPQLQLEVDKAMWDKCGNKNTIHITIEQENIMFVKE